MALPADFHEPFRLTYELVIDRITDHPVHQNRPPTSIWLGTVTHQFQVEWSKWQTHNTYLPYFDACEHRRLRFKFLHLTACAYLHISYDLPRVIADNWPPKAPSNGGPSENVAEDTFFDLNDVFPEAFASVAQDRNVMGIFSFPFRLPESIIVAASHWTMHLRTAAWIHARRLASLDAQDRQTREDNMMIAMVAALQHVCNRNVLSPVWLRPPFAVFPPLTQLRLDLSPTKVLVSAAAVSVIAALLMKSRQQKEVLNFINEFGWKVLSYTNEAVRNRRGFLEYIASQGPLPKLGK